MPMDSTERFDEIFAEKLESTARFNIESEGFTASVKNLKSLSDLRPPQPEPELITHHVPTTVWEKFKCGAAAAWDNETTRVLIKAGGSLAGVITVVYATVHRDHVINREAMTQANQRN